MARRELQTSGEPQATQKKLRQEQREDQPFPNVWNFLEKMAKLCPRDDQVRRSQYWGNVFELWKQEEKQLRKKGSDYDQAILDVYATVTRPFLATDAPGYLTVEQFRQFRSDFEELSPEEIAEKNRQIYREIIKPTDTSGGLYSLLQKAF